MLLAHSVTHCTESESFNVYSWINGCVTFVKELDGILKNAEVTCRVVILIGVGHYFYYCNEVFPSIELYSIVNIQKYISRH